MQISRGVGEARPRTGHALPSSDSPFQAKTAAISAILGPLTTSTRMITVIEFAANLFRGSADLFSEPRALFLRGQGI